MLHPRIAVLAGAASAAAAIAGPNVASGAPSKVEATQGSTVQIVKSSGNDRGVAIALPDQGRERGLYLTTLQTVSRTRGIEVVVPGEPRPFKAVRRDSSAPPGLAIIQVPDAPKAKPLRFATNQPSVDSTVWVVAPRAVLRSPKTTRVDISDPECTDGRRAGLLNLASGRIAQSNGSPVVNAQGRVVGLIRSPRDCASGTQAVIVSEVPQVFPEVRPPERGDFPAQTVVIGLGAFLLLGGAGFRFLRRAPAPNPLFETIGEFPPPVPDPAVAFPQSDDGIEVTLRSKAAPAPVPTPPGPDDDLLGEIRLK